MQNGFLHQFKWISKFSFALFPVCENGQYILNGQCVSCKGHCKTGTYCDKLTGRCNEGCDTQWNGDFCERKYTTIYTYI